MKRTRKRTNRGKKNQQAWRLTALDNGEWDVRPVISDAMFNDDWEWTSVLYHEDLTEDGDRPMLRAIAGQWGRRYKDPNLIYLIAQKAWAELSLARAFSKATGIHRKKVWDWRSTSYEMMKDMRLLWMLAEPKGVDVDDA